MPRSLPSNSLDEESTFLREKSKLIDEVVVICKRREVFLRDFSDCFTKDIACGVLEKFNEVEENDLEWLYEDVPNKRTH